MKGPRRRSRNKIGVPALPSSDYYTQAGPVRVRRQDGTAEEVPALDPKTYAEVTKVRWGIPLGVRQKVWKRDKGTCRYCGGVGEAVDHVVPIALGGSNRMRNLVVACTRCNTEKGANVWKPRSI